MTQRLPVVIVGAGFSGLAVAIGLLRAGHRDLVVLERGDDVGGTWRDNTYPGCACDVPSHLYSFSFAPNPSWSRTFSPQPEIQEYLRGVARDFGVLPFVRFGVTVTGADWDDDAQCWHLATSDGPIDAAVLVAAGGGLSEPAMPAIEGLDSFGGALFHSARWRHDHSLAGERVAVIGTGASAVQIVPAIVPEVAALTLFQRTAPWVTPRRNRPIPPWRQRLYARVPAARLAARGARYASREALAVAFTRYPRLLEVASAGAVKHLHDQVPDPVLREKLTPHYAMGCKRILPSDEYYPALTRPHVRVETSPIERVTATAVVTADGVEHEVDTIVLATGFEVQAPPVAAFTRGREGRSLAQVWHEHMTAYLGTTVSGFPNLFVMVGPNTGLGHSSIVYMIESQARYVVDAIGQLRAGGLGTVEVRADVQERYAAEMDLMSARTVWLTGGCGSWYLDSRGRNTTLWPGFTFEFRRRTRRFSLEDYVSTPARRPVAAP